MSVQDEAPFCVINGAPATWDAILPAVTQNYGHITMLQMRGGKVRGLPHHLDRLSAANQELFGQALVAGRVLDGLRAVAMARPDATVRVNVFPGEAAQTVMVTAMPPVEPHWRPARFSLLEYERDVAHLKHVGSFGLSLRQRMAIAAGYDGAVFHDRAGEVSEATIWNVGFLDRGSIVWPSAPSLRGVTQRIIDEGLRAEGLEVRYEPIRVENLSLYEAAFLSNSTTFGRPLSAIGEASYEPSAPLTETIRRAYERTPFRSVAGP